MIVILALLMTVVFFNINLIFSKEEWKQIISGEELYIFTLLKEHSHLKIQDLRLCNYLLSEIQLTSVFLLYHEAKH